MSKLKQNKPLWLQYRAASRVKSYMLKKAKAKVEESEGLSMSEEWAAINKIADMMNEGHPELLTAGMEERAERMVAALERAADAGLTSVTAAVERIEEDWGKEF